MFWLVGCKGFHALQGFCNGCTGALRVLLGGPFDLVSRVSKVGYGAL